MVLRLLDDDFVDIRLTILALLPLPLLSLMARLVIIIMLLYQDVFCLNDKVQESVTGLKSSKHLIKEDVEDFKDKVDFVIENKKVALYDSYTIH